MYNSLLPTVLQMTDSQTTSQPKIVSLIFWKSLCLKCSITWVSQASFTTLFASHVKASARNGKALGPLASTNLWIFVGGIRTDLKHGELGELWFKIKHTSFNLNFQTDIIGSHLGDLSFEAYKTFHVNVNYAGFFISFFGGSLTGFPDVLLLSEYGGRTSGRASITIPNFRYRWRYVGSC